MDFIFIPLEHCSSETTLIETLRDSCLGADSLEQVLASWLSPRAILGMGLNRELPTPHISITYEVGKCARRALAIGSVDLREVDQHYGGVIPLNETTFLLADKNGLVADQEWFDMRNAELNITYDDHLGRYLVPPEAVVPLMLMYASSSFGFAMLKPLSPNGRMQHFLELELVFLGEEDGEEVGWWYEKHLVPRSAFLHYAKRAGSVVRKVARA